MARVTPRGRARLICLTNCVWRAVPSMLSSYPYRLLASRGAFLGPRGPVYACTERQLDFRLPATPMNGLRSQVAHALMRGSTCRIAFMNAKTPAWTEVYDARTRAPFGRIAPLLPSPKRTVPL